MLYSDYHIHTCLRPVDDGAPSMTPEFLANHFQKRGMTAFGLSPHVHFDADFAALTGFLEKASESCARRGMKLYKGVETECVDAEGNLTVPESVVKQLDYVIASGEHFNCAGVVQPPKSAAACTQFHLDLLMKLARNPLVDVLAHPFAGLILLTTGGYMPGYEPVVNLDWVTDDWLRLFGKTLVEHDTAVELNGFFTLTYPAECAAKGLPSYVKRYKEIYRLLAEQGVLLVPSSDAHTPEALAQFDHAAQWLDEIGVPNCRRWHLE